ncbi:MAG: Arm DNA-binding domain-containing protein [Alphaproteobacteria bacterium]|nr:Arm DNA-binding domain-containing protein [Alphaproteobacteria bacterium]
MTSRSVAALKPPAEGRVEYFDASLPGFALRVSESGRRTWVVLYRVNGRLRRYTFGTYPMMPLADARDRASDALRDASKGIDPADRKKAARVAESFADLANEYLERHA